MIDREKCPVCDGPLNPDPVEKKDDDDNEGCVKAVILVAVWVGTGNAALRIAPMLGEWWDATKYAWFIPASGVVAALMVWGMLWIWKLMPDPDKKKQKAEQEKGQKVYDAEFK